jgi:hypothetical protein
LGDLKKFGYSGIKTAKVD